MPILDPNTFEFFSRSPGQTRRVGIRLGALLQVGDLVCLSGDLGSGKTTLMQGITQGWGSPDLVTSPTFVLVN
ncbi:MAG: tRNA (adenosine(37)-N6)-threonylcarbamoyltransferase complex ATPase subunit type 1 TsaE, partial [Anaerolineaceae bacterium]|nr:tRNA (adenosine(37)-N6)-threonylcarbamoyltransferase complex ATPase subunit type 1 TsaE [Anaerolineaceae bacterium]